MHYPTLERQILQIITKWWGGVPCRSVDFAFVWLWQVTGACPTDSLDWMKITCISCCKQLTDFGIGDLKELKVVVVGMPGSGAKSLVTCWTGASEIQSKLGAQTICWMTSFKKCCGALWFFFCLSLFAYLCYHSLHIPCMLRKNDFFRFLEQVGKAWSDLLRRFGYNYWPWDPNVVRGQSALMSNIICTFKSSVWKGSLFQCVHLGTFLPQMCWPLW